MELSEMSLLFLAACLVRLAAPEVTKVDYLYYSSPKGVDITAGVYAGAVNFRDDGAIRSRFGHHCLEPQSKRYHKSSLPVKSMSYDAKSHHFIMQVDEGNDRLLTVLRVPICTGVTSRECLRNRESVLFNRLILEAKHEIGPVILYNHTIYFIRTANYHKHVHEYVKIELRKMEKSCEDRFLVEPQSEFDVEACSKWISTLVDEKYDQFPGYKVTAGLVAVTNNHGRHEFFTQLQKLTYQGKHLDRCLMQLIAIDQSGRHKVVDELELNKDYFKYSIKHIGGVAHRDGKLCWSMLDTIKCAEWTKGRLHNPRIIVYPGNASRICKGGAGKEKMFANITTGLAISDAKKEVALYFGCMSQDGLAGGAGLVRMPGNGQSAQFFKLEIDSKRVYAGSMFITDQCAAVSDPKAVILPSSECSMCSYSPVTLMLLIAGGIWWSLFISWKES